MDIISPGEEAASGHHETDMDIYNEFESVIEALESEGIDYALCGGIAVFIYGYERLTQDIDLLVLAKDVSRIKEAVRPLGFDIDSGEIPFGVGTPQRRVIHRVTKIEGSETLLLDLMVVSDFLRDVWESRKVMEWKDKRLRIVSTEGLVRLKKLAGRLKDLADIEGLGLVEDRNGES
jgi:hypothetical protein